MNFTGKVFKYGDNVNTDVIIPARCLNDSSLQNLRAHAMEDIDLNFAKNVCDGDIVVGGANFGLGSSREHAPLALKASGIKLVIAKSFARIFFRNSINIGLYIIENAEMADEIANGDILTVDCNILTNNTTCKTYNLPKLTGFVGSIIESGGLMNAVRDDIKIHN